MKRAYDGVGVGLAVLRGELRNAGWLGGGGGGLEWRASHYCVSWVVSLFGEVYFMLFTMFTGKFNFNLLPSPFLTRQCLAEHGISLQLFMNRYSLSKKIAICLTNDGEKFVIIIAYVFRCNPHYTFTVLIQIRLIFHPISRFM